MHRRDRADLDDRGERRDAGVVDVEAEQLLGDRQVAGARDREELGQPLDDAENQLIMLSLLTQSISNASFAIYFPKFVGSIYELLSAPVSYLEIVIAYVGGAATKSIILGLIILATASLFVPLHIEHPVWMLAFLVLTAVTFSLFGFIIGIWAKSFEQLQLVPLLIITPLTFLGGSFYSINMLPDIWRTVTLFNPVVYLISGFRWSFYGKSDVSVGISLGMTVVFLLICIAIVAWIFRTGYRLRN